MQNSYSSELKSIAAQDGHKRTWLLIRGLNSWGRGRSMPSSLASPAWQSIGRGSWPSASAGFRVDMITLLACAAAIVLSLLSSLPLSLSLTSRTPWPAPPSAAHSKSSSYWTTVIVWLADISDILPTTSCTPRGVQPAPLPLPQTPLLVITLTASEGHLC